MLNKRIVAGVLFIALLVGAAYGMEYFAKNRGLNTGTIIKMQSNNQVVAFLGIEALRKLEAAGPSLKAVLAAAGIDGFDTVEIKGLKSETTYRLHKGDINQDLNFMFTDRGTVDLCNTQAKQRVLVKDVSEIHAVTKEVQ